MSIISQYEINRKVRRAYQTAIASALLFGGLPIIDYFRSGFNSWMWLPILYALTTLISAYGIYQKKIIAGLYLCFTMPFYFIFFVKKSFTLAIIIALYLCIDGVYAIFKYHQQNSNL